MIQTMIWSYIVICLSLSLFQIGFLVVMEIRARREQYLVSKIRRDILHQMERLSQNRPIADRHRAFLVEELPLPVSLYRYEKALDSILEEVKDGTLALCSPKDITNVTIYIRHRAKNYDNEEASRGRSKIFMRLRPKKELISPLGRELAEDYFARYLRSVSPEIISLTSAYRKKDSIVHTFYVFVLKKYHFPFFRCTSELVANLKDLLEEGGTTACEGVLLAVYTVGDPALVSDFLALVDKQEQFVHPKIVSDGLLYYGGNTADLHARLLADLHLFSLQMQVNLLNYMRFCDGTRCEEILKILTDPSTFDEVRFCCIRYFGKYHYDPAYEILADYADSADRCRIEYAVVALMALRNYPSERTLEILHRYIRHPNWFVRYNATESMELLGVEYQDLIDIFDGADRYAREMLQYQFDQRYALEEEVALS